MKPEKNKKTTESPENRARKHRAPAKKGSNTLIIAAAAVILLIGIAYAVLNGGPSQDKKEEEIKFPDYVYTDALALKTYTYATQHPDVLEQIPCYCGCGGHSEHRFVRDCFIKDDWTYDEHARYCDVCMGIAMKTQRYLEEGKTLKEARALIDNEYAPRYADGRTNTPPVSDNYKPILTPKLAAASTTQSKSAPQTDLSSLSLPGNFKSLSDGLKLVPAGISWAYFANLKQGVGIEQVFMPGPDFYGIPMIGMLNSEYPDGTFVELHDVGKSFASVKSNAGNNVDNVLNTRPFIFSTSSRTGSVMALITEPGNGSAYKTYESLLEKVNDENAGYAKINTVAPSFADASYIGLVKSGNEVIGEIAYSIKKGQEAPLSKYSDLKNSSPGRGFRSYDIIMENNTLIIRMTSNLISVRSEVTQNYGIEI